MKKIDVDYVEERLIAALADPDVPDLGPDFHKRVAAAVHRDMAEVRRKAASVSGNLFEALALKFALAGGGLAAALAVCARFSSAALDAQIVRSALSGSSLFYYFS